MKVVSFKKAANRAAKNELRPDAALAKKVALSCRILAKLGLFKETTGHVSARNPDGATMLIRGRGGSETGLLFTRPADIVLADFDGAPLKNRAGLKTPNEACIHGELYKRRQDVGGVVHAHPPAIVLTSMAGIPLRPIFGGYDPQGMRIAIRGVPTYESSLTLHSVEQVHEMLAVMGDSDVCVLRGHGVVVVGRTIEEATIKAIKLDHLAEMNLRAAALGNVPSISQADIERFLSRKQAPGRTQEPVWRYYEEWEKRK
ncbi:MAG TPA: class II aldolase/adducin family protein [Candidatus Binatia bacterium]|jgi:ribulose-5-phosphate 4-epimerase/fuculose-1-phosphate aldolase|nr:class II aldolase/adducin family protein [Candidatus Binatia bacterium]